MKDSRHARPTLLLLLMLALTPALARAQGACPPDITDLDACLNFRVKKVVGAKTEQNGTTKQKETPSVSENSTSIVDESSAPDLVSTALNLAGLSASSKSDDKEADSVSVTATAYALYAQFKGFDQLNPYYYDKYRDWRRFSFTLGFDNEDKPGGASGEKQRVKLFGAKYLLINRRDPNRTAFTQKDGVFDALFNATAGYSTLINRTRAFLFRSPEILSNIVEPEFADYLTTKDRDVTALAAAARRVAGKAADPNRALSAADAQSIVSQVVDEELPTLSLQRSKTRLNSLRAIAAAEAAKAGSTPQTVASALDAAASKLEAERDATLARTTELRKESSGTLFEFDPKTGLPILAGPRRWSDEEFEYHNLFVSKYGRGTDFERLRGMINEDMLAQIDGFIEDELKSFTELDNASLRKIQAIRNAPQLSVAFFTKQRGVGADEHKGEVVFDYGMGDRLNLSLNGAFVYTDSKTIGADTRVGDFGAKLKWQLNRNKLGDLLNDRTPVFFDLAADGKWGNGVNSMLKAQAKLTIPIGAGLELPLSLTVANRTEFVKEKEVRGQFGFTFDFSKLIKSLAPAVLPK